MIENIKNQPIESRESRETFSGNYGLVIQQDHETNEKARQLARSLAPQANFLVEAPHVTLYYANFKNLPNQAVQKTLLALQNLRGLPLKLRNLQVFGDKFLFWDIIKTDELQSAHEQALTLAKYLDPKAQADALKEELSLTKPQMESLKKYGHPLMDDLYLPHITLAYDPKGITLPPDHLAEECDMQASQINFAEMGELGVVKNVIKFEDEKK